MNNFLNIYDLADFIGIQEIDIKSFKRVKKRILAELELEDNQIKIKNQIFTRSDCLNLFDEIEKKEKVLRFYLAIFQNKSMNNYFYGIAQKIPSNIFKMPKTGIYIDFFNFISPYFVVKFKKSYKEAFETSNIQILKFQPEVNPIFLEDIYSPIQNILESWISELSLSNAKHFLSSTKIESINALPNYFAKKRDDLAMRLRSLSVDAWNEDEDLDLAFNILDIAFKFEVSQKVTLKLEEDKNGLEDLKEKKEDNKKVEGFFELLNKLEEIKSYSANPSVIYTSLAPKIRKLDYSKAKDIFLELLLSDNSLDYYQKVELQSKTTVDFVKNIIAENLEKIAQSSKDIHSDYSTATKFEDLAYEVRNGYAKRSYSTPNSSQTSDTNYEDNSNSEDNADSFWGWVVLIGVIIYFATKD